MSLSSQLTAATARLIDLIGEFDAAEGWRDWGMRSTAQWLSWKTGIGLGAAREQIRVARSLRGLPHVAAAFSAGRLSYSKVRALTRFVTTASESELVNMAERSTGSQIERLAASARRARRASDVEARRKSAYVRWHQDDDGSIIGSFRLAPEQAAVFCHGLDAAAGRLPDVTGESEPSDDRGSRQARSAADALAAMADAYLKNVSAETSAENAERYQLVVHTTAEELANPDDSEDGGPGSLLVGGNGRQWRIAPSTARRLTCDCPASTMGDGRWPGWCGTAPGPEDQTNPWPVAPGCSGSRSRDVPGARMHRTSHPDPSHPALGSRRPNVPAQSDQPLRPPPLARARGRLRASPAQR